MESNGFLSEREGEMWQLLRWRSEALARFERWSRRMPTALDPAATLACLGFLWDLLPPESRQRPVDTAGVAAMHRLLAGLPGRP